MSRLFKKHKLKRALASFLVLLTVLGVFTTSNTVEVHADSNSLRETYIDLMSGASAVNATDIESLTINDLRCIALYLSNFYVPYNSSLDDTENMEDTKNNMINSLKNIGFKDDAAETLVNAVYQASLSSCKQLYFNKADVYAINEFVDGSDVWLGAGNDHKDPGCNIGSAGYTENAELNKQIGSSTGAYMPATMFTFLAMIDGISHSPDNEIHFAWGDNTSQTECFVLNKYTATIITNMVENIGHKDGKVGNGVLSTSLDDWVQKNEVERPLLCSFTQKLYVDWVGNIICDFGNTRVVIYPACINPYAFSNFDDASTGDRINLMSTWGQWFLNKAEATFDSGSYTVAEGNDLAISLLMSRGSTDKLTYDNVIGFWSKGTAAYVKEFLDSIGVNTGGNDSTNEKHEAPRGGDEGSFAYPKLGFSLDSTNCIYEFVQYATVSNDKIASLSNGSVFAVYNCLETSFSAFSNSSKFSSMSDKYDAYMKFDSSDYVVLRNFFLTYAFAYNNRNKTAYDDDCYVHFKFNASAFPESLDTSIVWDDLNTDSEKIVSFIYYLLHPTEGVQYVATLFKNKVSGVLVSWHEDIVGATDSNSTTGMTQYLGFTGYVTSPSLDEISWIRNLVDWYTNIVVYLIILIGIILLCYILIGHMTIWRAIVGVILFGVLAFIPPIAINAVTDSINVVCDTIYSDKFDYWSYTQLQTYIGKLSSAVSANTVNDYITRLMELETNSSVENKNGFSGVKLKWMTPKKVHEEANASEELHGVLDFSSTMISILTSSLSATNKSEEYTDKVGATYLYRDLVDIYRYGAASYNLWTTYNHDGTLGSSDMLKIVDSCNDNGGFIAKSQGWNASGTLGAITYSSLEPLKDYVMANNELTSGYGAIPDYIKETSSLKAIRRGFINNSIGVGSSSANYYTHNGNFATSSILTYTSTIKEVNENYRQLMSDLGVDVSTAGKIDTGRTIKVSRNNFRSYVYGLDPKTFSYSLDDFMSNQNTLDMNSVGSSSYGEVGNRITHTAEGLGSFYYALYAESPYYYFNNVFRDYVLTQCPKYSYNPEALQSSAQNIYQLFVDDNQSFFFNLTDGAGDGYGELRDFMNMHDLFYYVIPVMDDGNKIADTFDALYGMSTYSDLQLQITSAGKIKFGGREYEDLAAMGKPDATFDENGNRCSVWDTLTDEEMYKFWHDYNVWTIFQSYVPWIDTMEDCGYADPETISVLGEKFVVMNPLDPTTYYKVDDSGEMIQGRYMIFSRSEMAYYGLDMADLTEVEQKIIKVQDNVYDKSLDLMNYYTLADEVMINGFAMIQTFEFNKEFSESSILGSSYIMYPQGYEAKAFSYDAYLRLIIAEASGEPIQVMSSTGETSIYRRVLKNTSLFFGFFLLVNDVMSVYVIPCLKIAFLIMLFFISIALIVASAIKLELNIIQVVWKSVISPLLAYWLINVGFAWIVSLFMSNGASGVTDTSATISVGDPTTVVIIMIVINVSVVILLFKVCKKCFKDLKTYLLSVLDSISSTVVGAMKRVAGFALQSGKTYKTTNKMANGIPSTASRRGKENTDARLASGGLVAAAAGGIGYGLGASGGDGAGGFHISPAKMSIDELSKAADINAKPRNKYDNIIDEAQSRMDSIDAKRKKSGYEKSVQARDQAKERAERGLDSMKYGVGLRNKAEGVKDFVAGNIGAKYHGVANSAREAVGLGKDGKLTRAKAVVFGDGLSNADRRAYNRLADIKQSATKSSSKEQAMHIMSNKHQTQKGAVKPNRIKVNSGARKNYQGKVSDGRLYV